MNKGLSAEISLSQTLLDVLCKSVPNILFEISRSRIVKILTDMKSALNHKDSDIKYVFARVPKSCLNLG